jgi:hypothetical protein
MDPNLSNDQHVIKKCTEFFIDFPMDHCMKFRHPSLVVACCTFGVCASVRESNVVS